MSTQPYMSQIVPIVSGAGNTNSAPSPPISNKKKQDSACKHWLFTFNNHTNEEWDKLCKFAHSSSKVCVMQEETGESGTHHIQGYLEMHEKTRFTALKKSFESIHWEKVKSVKNAIAYCQKEETRTGRQYIFGLPEPIKVISELRPWQQQVLEHKSTDREIEWYYDELGGAGKTAFCKYLVVKHGASFFQGGKGTDILYPLTELYKQDPNSNRLKTIVFNFPRTSEGAISYSAIESIKDGIWFSGKYEGGQVIINSPRVIIFANWRPNESALSIDRWRIINLTAEYGIEQRFSDQSDLLIGCVTPLRGVERPTQ